MPKIWTAKVQLFILKANVRKIIFYLLKISDKPHQIISVKKPLQTSFTAALSYINMCTLCDK